MLYLQSSFESIEIVEDTRVGSKIVPIDVKDPDTTGMELSVNCTASHQVKLFLGFFFTMVLNDKEKRFFETTLTWMKSQKKRFRPLH